MMSSSVGSISHCQNDVAIHVRDGNRIRMITESSAPDPEIRSIHDAYNALSAVRDYLKGYDPLHDEDATDREMFCTDNALRSIDDSLNRSLVYLYDIIEG
jgi:hypothetical protein